MAYCLLSVIGLLVMRVISQTPISKKKVADAERVWGHYKGCYKKDDVDVPCP